MAKIARVGTLFVSNTTTSASATADLTAELALTQYAAVLTASEQAVAVEYAGERITSGYYNNLTGEFRGGRSAPVARSNGETWTAGTALQLPPTVADRMVRVDQGLPVSFA